MAELSPGALAWLADHHAVITARRLAATGVGRATRERLVSAGVLEACGRGVYRHAVAPATIEQRCVILCASHPAGFITGPTAGGLMGLRRMPRHAPLHLAVRHGARIDPMPGVRLRQTTAIRPEDRITRPDGIVLASPPRLAFDLAADLSELDLLSVMHQLVKERQVTADQLIAIERRLGHPARRGSGRFLRAVGRLGHGPPSDSHPELVLGELLRERGVPVVNQACVRRAASGRRAYVDLAVPDVRWGVELDIHPEHETYDGRGKDAHRVRELHGADWQIERVVAADMVNPRKLADELASCYRRRCDTFARHPRVV